MAAARRGRGGNSAAAGVVLGCCTAVGGLALSAGAVCGESLGERPAPLALSASYTNDLLGNVRGGLARGAVNQGKLEVAASLDLDRLAGMREWTAFANGFWIDNTGRVRRDLVGGLNTVAAIEAVPAVRLSELWVERRIAALGLSLRVGQLAADTEFFFAATSAPLLQSDWATIAAVNLPSGGPAYPLATPGARLKWDPSESVSLLLAVFNGDPAGPGPGDEQLRNRHGLAFRVRDPALMMAEAQWRSGQGPADTGLARTLKVGGWHHFGVFEDKRLAADGSLLADPAGSGIPAARRGNHGLYAVAEQQVWRPADGKADSGITFYGRLSSAPSDRNLVSHYADVGVVLVGMVDRRPHDKLDLGLVLTRFSDSVRARDHDAARFKGKGTIREHEANLELSYAATVHPRLMVQPVATYVWRPAGREADAAVVVGVRMIGRY